MSYEYQTNNNYHELNGLVMKLLIALKLALKQWQ